MEQEFFILLAVVATGSGLLVVLAKNPIHSALALVVCFVQIAALFVLLGSAFLAVIQIFVYVGAIMVLFLFVIMMLDVRKEAQTRFIKKGAIPSFMVLLILSIEVLFLLSQSSRLHTVITSAPVLAVDPTKHLSLVLFQDFLLPFEVASIILLVALIGAVLMARSEGSKQQKHSHKTAIEQDFIKQKQTPPPTLEINK